MFSLSTRVKALLQSLYPVTSDATRFRLPLSLRGRQAVAISWYDVTIWKQQKMGSAVKGGNPVCYYVYILTNRNNTVLYTGVTRDLIRRVYEHKNNTDPNSFTAKYKVHKLVYFEETNDVKAAIEREKQIKSWNRKHKNKLIESKNPNWIDLYSMNLI